MLRMFAHLVAEDRSFLDFYSADYSFMNERVADHYGIVGVTGSEFRRVDYPDERRRGGESVRREERRRAYWLRARGFGAVREEEGFFTRRVSKTESARGVPRGAVSLPRRVDSPCTHSRLFVVS